jgi:hypothetical protein
MTPAERAAIGLDDSDDPRQFYTEQGVVLVEIFWEHELLLDIPGFNPVLNFFNGRETTINVWTAFPAPDVAPELEFGLNWRDFAD